MHQAGGEMTLTCSKTLQQFEILLFFFYLTSSLSIRTFSYVLLLYE